MAIVIEQDSRCPLCNNFLDFSKKYILTPPIISNTKDDLFILSDVGVHLDCINQSILKDKILKYIRLYDEQFPLLESVCIVDDRKITNPNNLLFFGLLTSNESERLSVFNYIKLNTDNIKFWKDYDEFIFVAQKFLLDGKWQSLGAFNFLEYIVNKLKEFR